jgi:hypothetical protein
MSAFQWSTVYDATATQTTTIKVAGETTEGMTADYIINVSTASLASHISYSGAYGTTLINDVLTASTYPTVTVDLPALVAAATDLETEFHGSAQTLSGDQSAVPTLAGMFKSLAGEFGTSGPTAFGGIYPVEAVVGVSYGAVTADTVASLVEVESSSTDGDPPVLLWENLLAAGKIPDATLQDGNSGGFPQFVAGDSVSVFVSYTLGKTRMFELDGAAEGSTASFSINGVSIGEGVSEESTLVKKVEWKFVQT